MTRAVKPGGNVTVLSSHAGQTRKRYLEGISDEERREIVAGNVRVLARRGESVDDIASLLRVDRKLVKVVLDG